MSGAPSVALTLRDVSFTVGHKWRVCSSCAHWGLSPLPHTPWRPFAFINEGAHFRLGTGTCVGPYVLSAPCRPLLLRTSSVPWGSLPGCGQSKILKRVQAEVERVVKEISQVLYDQMTDPKADNASVSCPTPPH